MADFSSLKNAVAAVIKTNGVQSITGDALQQQLFAIIDSINDYKVDVVSGKGLSANDLTNALVAKINSAIQQAGLDSAIAAAIATCVLKSDIVQIAGQATDKVMSQKAAGDTFVAKTDIVDVTGQGTDKVMSQKAITDILSGIDGNNTYGVRHNYNASSPTLTRIGNLDLHRTLPVQSKMRRCILDDNGNVVYYLDRNNSVWREDGQAAVLDGTHGQVMVEIPEHYRACIEDTSNGTYDVLISLTPFTGARKIKKTYVSAFEAVVDRTDSSNLKLSSVRNLTEAFRGGNNNAAYDGTYRSFLGMPTTAVSLTNFRTYANNRGENWHQYDWEAHCAIYWLFAIEYATLNSQAAFNADLDANGYHQGGLGVGVTNMNGDDWNAYNGYYPFVPCGYTLSLGDATGIVPLTFNAEQEVAYGAAYTTDVPSYRGIENPFGHIFKWTDGFLGLGDGVAQDVYVCRDKAHYASTLNDYYQKLGKYPEGTGGYPLSLVRNEYGDLFFPTMGGGSTTYFCDYNYRQVAEGTTYGLCVGGRADYGSYAGLAYLYSDAAPSGTAAYFGSRLCWSAE